LDHQDYKLLHILSEAVKKISEGELLQLEKARNLNLQEDVYYEIIRNKTASLLASACAAGAWATSQNEEFTNRLRKFGELTGMAFQIKDDLFDYTSEDIGKPTGNDIKESKLTLPLIYTLNKVDRATRKRIIYIVKNQKENKDQLNWVIGEVTKAGGIEYSIQKMNAFKEEAIQELHHFPDNPIRKGLEDMVRFVTDRKY
jgi:octaprenyl-diphosphate synthase